MNPNKEGIWQWKDNRQGNVLVAVYDCSAKKDNSHLRVYWWGGYYNVNDESVDPEFADYDRAEWTNGLWGDYVGPHGSVPEDRLYTTPSELELAQIRLDTLKEAVRDYLKHPSSDGNPIRQQKRKYLTELAI